MGLPARYLRGGNVRGRGLQKSRWRVRFGCIVATHPDGQDCDILRYCALFSILNGALRLAMAHRPPDLVAIFRAVSNPCWCGMVRPDRRPAPVRVMVAVPTALSRPHTARDRGCGRCNSEDRRQQVGIFSKFRQVSEITKDRRTLRGGDWLDLDKCPKSTKIAARARRRCAQRFLGSKLFAPQIRDQIFRLEPSSSPGTASP